jgi:hypothetical protein
MDWWIKTDLNHEFLAEKLEYTLPFTGLKLPSPSSPKNYPFTNPSKKKGALVKKTQKNSFR